MKCHGDIDQIFKDFVTFTFLAQILKLNIHSNQFKLVQNVIVGLLCIFTVIWVTNMINLLHLIYCP